MDLIADIGATNTRCALLDAHGREIAPEGFENVGYAGLAAVLGTYVDRHCSTDRPTRAALAVAAPIGGDEVRMVNIDWRFSQRELKDQLGLEHLSVVNDFAAVAWSLPTLGRQDVVQIGGGHAVAGATIATLGPGTGLGVSAYVPGAGADGGTIVSGEGGHALLPAVTSEEAAAIEAVRARAGECVRESVLSGPGLVNLYVALSELAGRAAPHVTPADVTGLADRGEPLAAKTQAMFFAMLGTVAADLALTFGARGGVIIAGGIVPRLLHAFERSKFRERFEERVNHREYLRAIPTSVITAPLPAFRGLRHLLGHR